MWGYKISHLKKNRTQFYQIQGTLQGTQNQTMDFSPRTIQNFSNLYLTSSERELQAIWARNPDAFRVGFFGFFLKWPLPKNIANPLIGFIKRRWSFGEMLTKTRQRDLHLL